MRNLGRNKELSGFLVAMLSLVTIATLVVVGLLSVLLYVQRFRKPANSPPYEAGVVPYLGVGVPFGKSPVDFTTAMYNKVGFPTLHLHVLMNVARRSVHLERVGQPLDLPMQCRGARAFPQRN